MRTKIHDVAEDWDDVTDEFSNHINTQPLPEKSPEVLAHHLCNYWRELRIVERLKYVLL